MSSTLSLNVPMNRVEGDLEIRVEVEDGVVKDAFCMGTMFRGFERILVGRGALDGLVITPRVCGICGTAHLTAAARALDMIGGVKLTPDATRIRNLALMAEHIQSDVRQGYLMYAVDFVNPAHRHQPLFDEAARRYTPFQGETIIEVIRSTKKVLEIVAILGGQWPHSSYMVPGGVVSLPSAGDLLQCRLLLGQYRAWYEKRILGCSVDRWRQVRSAADLDTWLDESDLHRNSDLGFFIRFAREIGLDKMGGGHHQFISFGCFDIPEDSRVRSLGDGNQLVEAGFLHQDLRAKLDQARIAEHVAYSWFEDYDGGLHPFEGKTEPYATGTEGRKYSWAKAPRYGDEPAETGPLAEALVARIPLYGDLLAKYGNSAFTRQLARLTRPTLLFPAMEAWLAETTGDGCYYTSPGEIYQGQGFGLSQAARGAIGHWVKVKDKRITHYQIITPTAWHASPRDSKGIRGPMEEALVGTPVRDPENPVELGHVVRSFDPCLVCTVHAIRKGKSLSRTPLGVAP